MPQQLDLDAAAVGKMIQQSPAILGLSIDNNLQPKLEWIHQRLSLTDVSLSNLIEKFPSIFSYNVNTNLEPTLNFYSSALGDEGEALTLVIQNPSLFGYSLENRLKPRRCMSPANWTMHPKKSGRRILPSIKYQRKSPTSS